MNAGWILCLAMMSQVPQYAPASTGWQPGGTAANNFTTQPAATQPTSAFGQQSRFAASGNAQQQPMGVVQYAQPIGPSPYPTQQPQTQPQQAQQFAQPNWQTNNSQFANQQQPSVNTGVGGTQFDSRWAQAQPQGAQNFASQQDQPTPAWGQPNPSLQPPPTQPAAPTLLAPQNARPTQNQPYNQPQGHWATQPQQRQNPLAASQQGQNWPSQTQPVHGSQFTGGVNGQSGQSQQFAGAQQQISPPPFNHSTQQNQGQVDSAVGGSSRFGAGIKSGDNQVPLQPIDPRQGQDPSTWPSIQVRDATAAASPTLVANNGHDPTHQINPPNHALQPSLHSTLPNGGEQPGGNRQGELTPYARAEPPRADGQRQPSDLTVTDSRWADVNSSEQTSGAVRVPFVSGVGIDNSRSRQAGYNQTASGQSAPRDPLMASAVGGTTGLPESTEGEPVVVQYDPKPAIIVSLLCLMFSLGANVYLGWIAFESHFRYRRLLVEGDDYDDSRRGGRDDEGGSRRR